MRRLFILAFSAIAIMAMQAQSDFGPRSVNYQLHWQWGLINMVAGYSTVNVECENGMFSGTMSGQSIVWEGRVYCVNDTLQAQMTPTSVDMQYVNGWYRKPRTDVHVDLNSPQNYVTILGQGQLNASPSTIEAVTITADMLSMYYLAQVLDFDSMECGQVTRIPITRPDGSSDFVEITYRGESDGIASGLDQPVYKITFNYSYDGVLSNYPVRCLISRHDRLPLLFASDIKIGHVEMRISE